MNTQNLQDKEQEMASNNARKMMNDMKYEIANELGVDLKKGYNGHLTAREAGSIGGSMVKRMIADVQKDMSNK